MFNFGCKALYLFFITDNKVNDFFALQLDTIAEQQRPADAAPPSHFARTTTGDGNCLVRSLSMAAFGTDALHQELRVRIACELALRRNMYLSPEYIARGTAEDGLHLLSILHATGDFHLVPSVELAFDCEVMAAVQDGKDLGMWHMLAAANVLQRKIYSIYPANNPSFFRTVLPDEDLQFPIYIQWTSCSNEDITPGWKSTHFVPIVKDRRHVSDPNVIRVGDFVWADFYNGDGDLGGSYRGVIVPRPDSFPPPPPGENVVCVQCLRKSGRYYVFPQQEDISEVKLKDVRKTQEPTINNRGHYFF